MKKLFIVFLLALSIVLFCACNQTGQYLIFGTFVEVDLTGAGSDDAAEGIEKVLTQIEDLMSVASDGSDVYRINEAEANERFKEVQQAYSVLSDPDERAWYDKNKHIFPASRWEVFDPAVRRDTYTIHDTLAKH